MNLLFLSTENPSSVRWPFCIFVLVYEVLTRVLQSYKLVLLRLQLSLAFLFWLVLLDQVVIFWPVILLELRLVIWLFVAISENPLVIDMINSCLVSWNTAVMGYLNLAICAPPDKDRRICWFELDGFWNPRASNEPEHYLCWDGLLVLSNLI